MARAVNRLGAFSLPFLSLEITHEMDATLTSVGVLLAAFGIATMISRLLGGWLADVCGRRATMVAGLVACALAQLGIAASESLVMAASSVVALGLAFEIYESPCQALIADSVDARSRAPAFGLLSASLSVAGLGAGLIATAAAPVSLRLLFVVDATTCLAAAVLVARLLPTDRPALRGAVRSHGGRSPWRDRRLIFLFATNVVFAASYLQVGVTLPLTLQHRGLAASAYGLVLVTASVVGLAAQPLLRSRRSARISEGSTHAAQIVGGYLLLAIGFAGFGFARSLAGFLSATVVSGVGEVLLAGHVLALVSTLAPADRRGRYLAAFGLSWGLAATLGPLPGTLLLEHVGDQMLWMIVAACCASVASAYAIAARSCGVATCQPAPDL